jgi:peptidoglycan/LPS O-acetylase OafA/YrhL
MFNRQGARGNSGAAPEFSMKAADPVRHANNFDFLRLVAALSVVFSHSFLIAAGVRSYEPVVRLTHNQCTLGLVGVFVFFVISGYLVTESYCRRPKPGGFVLRRFMRIYPALIPNGVLCALVLGPIVTSLPLAVYFSGHGVRDFLVEIATLWPGPLALPGVLFADTPVGLLINGSFWTLRFEVYMYAMVLILGVARGPRLSVSIALLVLGIAAIWWDERHSLMWLHDIRGWLWMLSHFAAGMVMYFLRDRIAFRWYWALLALAGLVVFSAIGEFITFFALSGGYLTIYAATRYWPAVDYARHVGDLSYGIYIYGWPCEEFVMWLSGGKAAWWQVFLGALGLVLPLAWLSWHGVEKWALRWVRGRRTPVQAPAAPETVGAGNS